MKSKFWVLFLSLFIAYSPLTQASFLTAIGKGFGKFWDEVVTSSSRHEPYNAIVARGLEPEKKTFDQMMGNNGRYYTIVQQNSSRFKVDWKPKAAADFQSDLDKQCLKPQVTEQIKNSVQEYNQFIDKFEARNSQVHDYMAARILVYVLNKQVIPSVGINFISVQFDLDSSSVKDINFELASMCGYSISYSALSQQVTINNDY